MNKEYCCVSGCLLDLMETDSEVEVFNLMKKQIEELRAQLQEQITMKSMHKELAEVFKNNSLGFQRDYIKEREKRVRYCKYYMNAVSIIKSANLKRFEGLNSREIFEIIEGEENE